MQVLRGAAGTAPFPSRPLIEALMKYVGLKDTVGKSARASEVSLGVPRLSIKGGEVGSPPDTETRKRSDGCSPARV